MPAFPIEIWYDKLRAIARSEVNRLVYAYGVPNLDRDDAEQHAVIEAWLAVTEKAAQMIPVSWGFVRIVMRRRLINEFIKKRDPFFVPLTIQKDGDEFPDPAIEMRTAVYQDNEDSIAMRQLVWKVYPRLPYTSGKEIADNIRDQPTTHDKRKRKTSRALDLKRRRAFIKDARRVLRRRYD